MKKLFLIFILLISANSWAVLGTPTFAQNFNSGTGQTSITATITVPSGDLAVAWVSCGSCSTDTLPITDSAGQTWTAAAAIALVSGNNARGRMYYVANSAALTSVTVNYSTGGGVATPGIVVADVPGAATVSPVDGTPVNSSVTGNPTTLTSGALTTANANDILLFGAYITVNQSTWTADTGQGYVYPANSTNTRNGLEYLIVSSTQSAVTTTITHNATGNAFGTFVAFKAASGAAAPNCTLAATGAGVC